MAVADREGLKQYCLRRLGEPVIKVNTDDTQLEDRIDEALEVYQEKHYDATENDWVFYALTQLDFDNGYITIPDDILIVMDILPFSEMMSQNDMFSSEYQLALSALSPWHSFNQLDYYMQMVNYESIIQLTSVTPTIQFSRHARKLKVFANITDLGVGYKFGVHVQRIINPDVTLSIYNDKWLKEFTTALFKRQWGENLSKFNEVQLLGGVTINGERIMTEAVAEIEKLLETLETTYQEPVGFIMG
jgi:hypothetical protein